MLGNHFQKYQASALKKIFRILNNLSVFHLSQTIRAENIVNVCFSPQNIISFFQVQLRESSNVLCTKLQNFVVDHS